MTITAKHRTRVFIIYSHKDRAWLERLRIHLRPLERDNEFEIWDDTRIKPGSRWRAEIRESIALTRVAILLVSADFLASDFITSNELPGLLDAAEQDGAIILPVVISPSRFMSTKGISDFQSVNPPSEPLINLTKGLQEEVFVKVAEHTEASLYSTGYAVSEWKELGDETRTGILLAAGVDKPSVSAVAPVKRSYAWWAEQTTRQRTGRVALAASFLMTLVFLYLFSSPFSQGVSWAAATGLRSAFKKPEMSLTPPDTSSINVIAFSPSGERLGVVSADTVDLWHIPTKTLLFKLRNDTPVTALALSKDEKLIASGDNVGVIKLWNGQTGALVETMGQHAKEISSLAFSSDGTILVSGGTDDSSAVWSVRTGRLMKSLVKDSGGGGLVAISSDGTTFSTAHSLFATEVRLWDRQTGQLLQTLTSSSTAGFSSNGTTLTCVETDGSITVRDSRTAAPLRSTRTHELFRELGKGRVSSTSAMAISNDGNYVVSSVGSNPSAILVVSCDKFDDVYLGFVNIENPAICAAPDGKSVGIGNSQKIDIWRIEESMNIGRIYRQFVEIDFTRLFWWCVGIASMWIVSIGIASPFVTKDKQKKSEVDEE